MIVYQLLSPTGKSYVGKTAKTLEKRWRQHLNKLQGGFAIHAALRKYGPENFVLQELSRANNSEQLSNLEKVWIILLQSAKPGLGYNLTWGGDGGDHTEATRAKLREAQKKITNRSHTPEARAKISRGVTGIKRSPEHKAKLSLLRQGTNNHFCKLTEEQVLAIRKEYVPWKVTQAFLGKKYNINASVIAEIVSRKIWKHI